MAASIYVTERYGNSYVTVFNRTLPKSSLMEAGTELGVGELGFCCFQDFASFLQYFCRIATWKYEIPNL